MGSTKLLSHKLLLKVQSELTEQDGREKRNFEWSRGYEKMRRLRDDLRKKPKEKKNPPTTKETSSKHRVSFPCSFLIYELSLLFHFSGF